MKNKKARNIGNISSLLNYYKIHLKLLAGIEPATSTLPRWRSTDWAKAAFLGKKKELRQ